MRRTLIILVCGVVLALPAGAVAAGAPVPSDQGLPGVTVPGSPYRYVALSRRWGTLVARVRAGSIVAASGIAGRFGVPGAALDGSSTGLSADGRTLVLANVWPTYPPTSTQLVVLDARSLRVEGRIAFAGFYTVDAISPTGRWLYLIHYRSPTGNPASYEVRAYDLVARRMLRQAVVDPREPDEKMQGIPMTRTMSPDGRWAYTLYMGSGGPPFIHALDTAGRAAYCVDLPALGGADPTSARLLLGPGGTLRVLVNGVALAFMNTRTLAVRPATQSRPAVRTAVRKARPAQHAGTVIWPFVLAALVAVSALVLLGAHRRRPRAARGAQQVGAYRVDPH
jgi:hypothetical protein